MKRIAARGIAAVLVLGCAEAATAAFIPGTFTGSGAGQGISVTGTPVYAVDAVNTGNVIQGVTFTPITSTSGVALSSGDTSANFASGIPTYSDSNLNNILEGFTYLSSGSSFTETLTVIPGTTYNLEFIMQEVADKPPTDGGTINDRDFNIALSSADASNDTVLATLPTTGYNSSTSGITDTDSFTAATSTLVITYTHGSTGTGLDSTPAENAFILTATPEPATLSLLGLSAAGLLFRHRRQP